MRAKKSPQNTQSVILLSGGLDSAANLAISAERKEALLALTVDYGQRAAASEVRASKTLAKYYGVRHEVVELKWLGALGGSALTDPQKEVPVVAADQLDQLETTQESAKAVWVPNRNGIFISVASAYAERLGAGQVLVGFNREEGATFPDNTPDFMAEETRGLQYSTSNHVRVHSFTVFWDKSEMVRELTKLKLPFPFASLWSCYHSGEVACGKCESCQRYIRATQQLDLAQRILRDPYAFPTHDAVL